MTSVSKKLIVLLWKCVILRKRNWILTIFEFISPILLVLLLYFSKAFADKQTGAKDTMKFGHVSRSTESSDYRFNSSFREIYNSPVNIEDSTYIAYAPNTVLTDELMTRFKASVDPDRKLSVEAMRSEADLELALRENLQSSFDYRSVLGVLFSDQDMTYKYKIMGNFDDGLEKSQIPDTSSMLFKLQVYLDAQHLESLGVSYEDSKVLIGEFIYSGNETQSDRAYEEQEFISLAYLTMLHIFLTFTYTFLVTAVVRDTIQEKSSGIKELMRVMGLSSWMIWTHWFIYSMFIQVPVTVIITVLLTLIPPPVLEVNAFIVWVLFLLVTIDYIVILFVVTCFFDRATKATVVCVLLWIIINFALLYVINPRKHSFPVQVLISLVPMMNLSWTLNSLQSFHMKQVDWDLSCLFTKGYTGSQVSAGAGIVILICEIILFTLFLAYIDAVKPGRYGIAKPLTFIFGYCIKQWQNRKESQLLGASSLPAHFELPPPGTKVGIGIRGLHKKFGVFKKAVAVECVNLDIYEREVTVLLGHNGAGKTTTMSMITGMFSPTRGTVTVDGKNIYDNLYNFRQNLGLCTQHNLYFPKLTVIEHLIFFGMLKGRSRSQAKEEGRYLLYMLNLVDKKDLRGSKLSGGMLRRLCLAVALTGAPKVLILDEPTSGLDPENRRHIWDIILSLRGGRTILITTHYMEEADVLGDRIAIMDHGKVVCCGTTMFLKKLYGTGYSVHITKSPRASPIDITQTIERYIPQFTTKVVSPAQVDYSIKDEFVERFPNLFSALESSMGALGMTAISVSCTTMEDVFLRVAELTEGQDQDGEEQKPSNVLRSDCSKVEGVTLTVQRIEALILKRALYISKHLISTIIKLMFACLLVLAATLLADNFKYKDSGDDMHVNQRKIGLTLYPDDFIYPIIYDESNVKTAKIAQTIIENANKGRVFMMKLENASQYIDVDPTNQPMNMFLSNIAYDANLSNRVVLASTFIDDDLLIQYQPVLDPYASSNAANLMANVLLKRAHPDRSIVILSQSLSSVRSCMTSDYSNFTYTVLCWYPLITFALTIVISGFTSLTVEERVTGFKYQQIIAGVSPLTFQLSSIFCDFCLYIVFVLFSFVIILIFGSDVIPATSEHMAVLILVLILYGVSSIIFINAFSLLTKSAATTTGLYIVINLVLILVCAISLIVTSFQSFYIQIIVTVVLSFHPTAAGFFALYIINLGFANDSVCYFSTSLQSYLGFPSSSNRFSILIFLLFLVVDIVLYSIIVFIVDSKIYARMTYKRSGINDCQGGDDDVKFETQRVRMFKAARVDSNPLRVEGLVKNYGSLRAANQVSFLVSRGECFGLLGVNGAGKTTTFKMLTGEIAPSSGDAVSTKYSVVSQTRQYLSNIGYCPQYDAILDDLTGNNTLTIIAKIRGVPRNEVRRQVDYWMRALGIEEHAHKATHTYSGGTKRKLGTAMAFIGEPIVALLDEPTTGVDPAARRKVWSAVKGRQSSGLSAVLSSHSMEECEALCSRLTIMRRGELSCIGSVQELKTKFGQGFVVSLKLAVTEDYQVQLDSLKREFQRAFPKSVIQDENINMMTYRVLDGKTLLSRLFSEVIRLKRKYTIIEDYIVSNATLEQLFLEIARGTDIRPQVSSNPTTRRTVNFDV